MIEELRQHIRDKKVLNLGIGNCLLGDDAVGSILAERLAKKLDIYIIDASDVPENYLDPIIAQIGCCFGGDPARANENRPKPVTKRGYCDEGAGAIADSIIR